MRKDGFGCLDRLLSTPGIIFTSDRYPGKRDANHVASIYLRRGTDPEEFVVRMETFFRRVNRQHCRFDVDFRTNPQEIERVLRRRGYVPYGAVAQVYRGGERSDAPRPARVPVRIEEVRNEAGLEKWRPLSYESYGGVHEQKRGYGVASSLIRRVVAQSRAAGDNLTFLFANSIDTPRYMYERLGFQDLMETTEWLKAWADTEVSETV